MANLPFGNTITLAPRHDLCVRVIDDDGSEKSVLVSSAVMCLASPVWDAMLNPSNSFQESKTKQVDFSDDNAEAVVSLLRIAHLHHSKVPTALKFEQLDQLAVLCDKYDTVTLVRPWLGTWVTESMKTTVLNPGYERWLFVAYTFGFADVFEKIAKDMVFTCKIDPHGQCFRTNGQYLQGSFPLDIIESIMKQRHSLIELVIQQCSRYVDSSKPDFGCSCTAVNSGADSKAECCSLTFGSLAMGLRGIGLWPLPATASEVRISANALRDKLASMKVLTYKDSYDSYYSRDHSTCNPVPVLMRAIDTAYSASPSPVTDAHRRHIETQSKK